jgi:hypothetical protein
MALSLDISPRARLVEMIAGEVTLTDLFITGETGENPSLPRA